MGSETSVQHFKYNPQSRMKTKGKNNFEEKQINLNNTKTEKILGLLTNKNKNNKTDKQKQDKKKKVNLKEVDNFTSMLLTFENETKEEQKNKDKGKNIKTLNTLKTTEKIKKLKKLGGQFMKPSLKEVVIIAKIAKEEIEEPNINTKIHRIKIKDRKTKINESLNLVKSKTEYPILLKSSLEPVQKKLSQNTRSNCQNYPKILLKPIDYELDLQIQAKTKNPLLAKSETMKNSDVASGFSITKKIRSSKELASLCKKDRKKNLIKKIEFQCKNPIPKNITSTYVPDPNTIFQWVGENGALKSKGIHKYYKQAITSKS